VTAISNTAADPVTLSASSTCIVGHALAAGASCTVIYTASKTCIVGGYTYHATITNAAGSTNGASVSIPYQKCN
jgi:hypothetical protein